MKDKKLYHVIISGESYALARTEREAINIVRDSIKKYSAEEVGITSWHANIVEHSDHEICHEWDRACIPFGAETETLQQSVAQIVSALPPPTTTTAATAAAADSETDPVDIAEPIVEDSFCPDCFASVKEEDWIIWGDGGQIRAIECPYCHGVTQF